MFDDKTVQDLFQEDLFSEGGNETVEILEFIKDNHVAISEEQLKAIFLLNELGMSDICNYVINSRKLMTTGDNYKKTIEKLTLADRIKGNAKLSNLLKANANPALSVQKMEDIK